jgi:glutathionyl-hydroquinone reductase
MFRSVSTQNNVRVVDTDKRCVPTRSQRSKGSTLKNTSTEHVRLCRRRGEAVPSFHAHKFILAIIKFTIAVQIMLNLDRLFAHIMIFTFAVSFRAPVALAFAARSSSRLTTSKSHLFSSSPSTSTTQAQIKPRDSLDETSAKGEFQRRDSAWRNWISNDPDAQFPPESGRYHLIVAMACPWAHRTLITRSMKGLQDCISISVVHPIWQRTKPDVEGDKHRGWVFGHAFGDKPMKNAEGRGGPFPSAYPGNDPDPLFGFSTVRDFYEFSNDSEGKYTVPVLFDKKTNTIVSNESADIIRMLNSEFNEFASNPQLDIYPDDNKELQDKINEVNDWVYNNLNNGVYRCGFAKSQEAYDKAIADLTEAFDKVEEILKRQRYIAGDLFTEADIRLFVTLVRFDEVYVVYFKCNSRSVATSPTILNYVRDIYQMDCVKETVNMEQIKAHYYCSHPELNYYSVIPKGSDFVNLLEQSHNRDNL